MADQASDGERLSSTSVAAIACGSILPVASALALALRFYAERRSKRRLTVDDWCFLVALVFVVASGALVIWCAKENGLGWPVQDFNDQILKAFNKAVFGAQLVWATAIALIRTGLLLFYRRVFSVRSFRMINNVVLGINGAWYISYISVLFLKFNWTPAAFGDPQYPPWLIANAAANVLQNLITLCLPLIVIRKLKIGLKRKVLVSLIFAFGSSCIVASIVRLKYLIELPGLMGVPAQYTEVANITWLWSVIEVCVSLITACLPVYPAAFREGRALRRLFAPRARVAESIDSESDGPKYPISKTVQWTVEYVDNDYNVVPLTPFEFR